MKEKVFIQSEINLDGHGCFWIKIELSHSIECPLKRNWVKWVLGLNGPHKIPFDSLYKEGLGLKFALFQKRNLMQECEHFTEVQGLCA